MERKLGIVLAPILLALALVPGSSALAATTGAATTTGATVAVCTSWVTMSSRNPGSGDNNLNAVAAVSATSVWAVGDYFVGATTKTLVEHWNGKTWKVVRSPNKGTDDTLHSVYVVSPTNIWAVGSYFTTAGRTLIEHWNGKTWKVVFSQNVGPGANELTAVRGTSGHDIWAVGNATTSYPLSDTVILHWNGRRWQLVPSPNVANRPNFLRAVRPVSPTDAWAVGRYDPKGGGSLPLVLHLTKGHWHIVSSPGGTSGSGSNTLNGVLATSSASAWAVGDCYNGTMDRTLILHWNGHKWLKSASPNVGTDSDDVNAVGATSAANIYAVGADYRNTSSHVLIERWNGSHWRVLAGRNPGAGYNIFNGVFALSARSIWAVGTTASKTGQNRTLIEHCR